MAEVLLVDDNGSVLLTLSIALRRCGHQVTATGGGIGALHELALRHFDVMVSDVRMAGMDGVELAGRVAALPNAPRIILTSAYASVDYRGEVADAFLRKPIDTALLDTLLRRMAPPACAR
jgi:CheY-like chemotaxis protein